MEFQPALQQGHIQDPEYFLGQWLLPKQEIYKKMRENYRVMASCIQPGSAPDLKSTSGLTGGDAYRMRIAVGAATILPMEAFSSDTARAR